MVCVKITFPGYKSCPESRFKEKFPPAEPPFDQFKKFLPPGMSIGSFEGVSINFQKKEITRFFRLYEYVKTSKANREKVITDILKWLDNNHDRFVIDKEIAFSTKCSLSFVFVPADYPYEKTNIFSELSSHPIIVITYHSEGHLEILTYNIESFCRLIRKLRGGEFFKHPKQLKAARTYFECYLANRTCDPWPGDIDALVCKQENEKYHPLVLVEFKTHNLNTPIEEERAFKYSRKDRRRLNALFIIQNALKVDLVYIIWSRDYSKIKVEVNPFSDFKKNRITKVCSWKDLKDIFLKFQT